MSATPAGAGIRIQANLPGRLVRRYKRFLADIERPDGKIVTVHCPNPGAMLGLKRPGSAVRCSTSQNPKRKLPHTLEMIRVGRIWVGLHTQRANQLAARALATGAVPGLEGFAELRSEVRVGEGSRLDFALSGHPNDPRTAYVEVKSVTLRGDGAGLFPDAVTERGRRHMEALKRLHQCGARAVVLFVVQRTDCCEVRPADAIDPAYGQALRAAVRAGVEVLALRAHVTARQISMQRMLPVVL
jgi:sugar fermentation stimulation protein A